MVFRDLREFVESVRGMGELKQVDGADWDLELGALTELLASSQHCPMVLFDNIKGYQPGYRVVTNLLHSEARLALAIGLSPELKGIDLARRWEEKLAKITEGPPPLRVKHGPVCENVVAGNDVDVLQFPAAKWHELDGGRYLPGAVTIMEDPEEKWINIGVYRLQVQDKSTLSLYTEPGRHGKLIAQKYWNKGQNCPVAISLGHTPALFIASALFVPYGTSEYNVAGLMNSDPIEVISGEVTGLPIPADAEVVFEGEVPPPDIESRNEGPFGEASGYYASGIRPEPVIRVKSMMYRNDPIIHGAPPMRPLPGLRHFPGDHRQISMWKDLERCGIPGIKGIWQHSFFTMVISLKQEYAGHAKQAALIAAGSRSSNKVRFIVTVDDDIDPYNIMEVMWAIGTRCEPERDIEIIREGWSGPVDPLITPEQVLREDLTATKVLIDACRPLYRRKDFPPVVAVSPELKAKMLSKWQMLFR